MYCMGEIGACILTLHELLAKIVCRSTQPQSSSFHRERPIERQHIRNLDCRRSPSTSSSESDEYLYSVQSEQSNLIETPKIHRVTLPQAKIKINNVNFPFMIDTGACINVMDKNAFSKLQNNNKHNPVKLSKPKTKIYAYGSTTPLQVHHSRRIASSCHFRHVLCRPSRQWFLT